MPTGRKPTPTDLRILRGNPGRRPLPKDEPNPEAVGETIAPPDWLSAAAKAEWRMLTPALARVGLVTTLDIPALAALCTALSELHAATLVVEREGAVIKSPTGRVRHNPWVTIEAGAFRRARALLLEFGLTPSSRTRVTRATPKIDPSNPLDKFIRK